MKLLFCNNCKDIFNLVEEKTKSCGCGKTTGMYLDSLNAVYTGDHAIPMAINNHGFREAVKHPPMYEPSINIQAFIIPVICKTFKKI